MNKAAVLLWLSGLLAGCAAATAPVAPQAPMPDAAEVARERGIRLVTQEVALSAPPAERYGEPVDHQLHPAEARLSEMLSEVGLEHAPGLSKMARELARTTPDSRNVPGELVDAVLHWAGRIEPRPRLTILELEDPGHRCAERAQGNACLGVLVTAAEGALANIPPGDPVFGVGVVGYDEGLTRVVVAVTLPGVELDPIPSAIEVGEELTLRGRLLGARRQPSLELIDPEERAHSRELSTSGDGRFAATFSCDQRAGVWQVELLAEGVHGPEVVANFPLRCGVELPRVARFTDERLPEGVTLADVVAANFAALNEERRRRGLPRLTWNEPAAEVARGHSEDMVRTGFVGHRSPRTGTATDRFRRASVGVALLRENIARGYGPLGMHRSLMASPGHRGNILSTDVTHVGIGAAWDQEAISDPEARRPIILTQNFYIPRGADAPEDPAAELRQSVDQLRAEAELPPIPWHSGLTEAAQALAEAVAMGDEEGGQRRYNEALRQARYQEVGTQMVVAASFSALVELDLWRGPLSGAVGLGVAQVTSGEREGALALIIAVGR